MIMLEIDGRRGVTKKWGGVTSAAKEEMDGCAACRTGRDTAGAARCAQGRPSGHGPERRTGSPLRSKGEAGR